MVAVMVIAFLVAWVPYATFAILKIIAAVRGQSSPVANMKSLTAYLPALLAKSSIIYNPIIYAVCNTQVTCPIPSSTFVSCAAAALANCNSFSILLPWLVSRSLVRHVQLPRAFDRARRTAQNDQIHFVQKVPEPKVIQPVIEKSPNFLLVVTLCHILHPRNQSRVTLN